MWESYGVIYPVNPFDTSISSVSNPKSVEGFDKNLRVYAE